MLSFKTIYRVAFALLLFTCCASSRVEAGSAVSTLYRDLCQLNQGWLERTPNYDCLPAGWQTGGDVAMIQTHLRLVIDQLESAETAQLTAAQAAHRAEHIAVLKDYMLAGKFPQNIFVAGRRPVFIDPWGTHCAVGYLIAASGNEDLAVRINAEHRLDYLADIHTDGLAEWQAASGLSLAELALIQPSYVYVELNYPAEVEDLIRGDSKAIMAAIEKDASLIDARCGGKTLLHYAAAAGDLELCKFLVEQGADIDAASNLTRKPVKPSDDKPKGPRIGVFSSSTAYNVRWNELTEVKPAGGGLRMGRGGRVYASKTGSLVAGLFNDVGGGLEGKTPLYFATQRISSGFRSRFNQQPVDKEIEQLNQNRELVAEWLKSQGATL